MNDFISLCRRPAVLDYGDRPIPLAHDRYSIQISGARVRLDVFDTERSISRRILSIEKQSTGSLDLTVHRFGGAVGKLSIIDLERPQTAHKALTGVRLNFAEQFRRMLSRQFPGWEIETLSASKDLQRSFSATFPRARLLRGHQQIIAMAAPAPETEGALLTFALIWFDHLRERFPAMHSSLALFVPERSGSVSAQRLRWLDPNALRSRLYRFNQHGSAGEVDPEDLGNFDTRVESTDPIYATFQAAAETSERALESRVRQQLEILDPELMPQPIHGQVLTFAAMDRDLIDLLAVSYEGRLVVIELKVSEDLHLPLQALDYWIRIRWHLERAELAHLFPSVRLRQEAPKLLLVAPAISFHSSNEKVLRYFRHEVPVQRIGINSDWSERLKVVMRLEGSDTPISHRGSHEYPKLSTNP